MNREFGSPTHTSTPKMFFKLTTVDDQGTFEGYASVFGNKDQNGDIVERGAYVNTLKEAKANGGKVLWPLFRMHNDSDPVGAVVDAREDARGLLITGACDLGSEAGRSAFSGVKMGYMDGLSIGYNVVRASRDQKGVRHLLEVKLWEVSLIARGYAANQEALIDATSVKSKGATPMNQREQTEFMRLYGNMRLAATTVTVPEPPNRAEFKTRREYDEAIERWHDQFRADRLPDQPNPFDVFKYPQGSDDPAYKRDIEAWWTARDREAGIPPLRAQLRVEREDANAKTYNEQLAAKCRAGTATVGDMLEYHRATGWTPTGQPLRDASGYVIVAQSDKPWTE